MGKNAMQLLNELIVEKNSRICAGLDVKWEDIPDEFKLEYGWNNEKGEENMEDFSQIIYKYCEKYIDTLSDIVPAIKINSSFFEREHLEDLYLEVAEYARKKGLFVIGDIKRADTGSSSEAYAQAFLGVEHPFNAITIIPCFGSDSVMPFLKVAKENGKGVFILIKTSNDSSTETQDVELKDGRKYYELMADLVLKWGKELDKENFHQSDDDMRPFDYPFVGAVVGATSPKQAKELVNRMGCIFFLVPEYGEQGETADDVAVNFSISGTGAIVNSTRGIMNAYNKDCWKNQLSEAARVEAIREAKELNRAIQRYYNRA